MADYIHVRFNDKTKGGKPTVLAIPKGQNIDATIDQYYADRQAHSDAMLKQIESDHQYSAASDNPWENLLAGIGEGMTDTVRSVGNMVGLESDKKLEDARALDKDLLNTKAGMLGSIVGTTALTAPLTGAGLGIAGEAAQSAREGSVLARALSAISQSGTAARAAAEGATVGAITANPGHRTGGAVEGAALGVGARGLGKVLKRAVVSGLATPTQAAQELMDQGMFIPLHQAADEGGVSGGMKTLYKDIIRSIPGAGGRLSDQTNQAYSDFRDRVSRMALPDWAQNELDGSTDIRDTMGRLHNFWQNKSAYGRMSGMKFNPGEFFSDPLKQQMASLPDKVQAVIMKYLETGNGQDIIELRNNVIPKLPVSDLKKRELQSAIDEYVKRNLDPNGNGANRALLQNYLSLGKPHEAYQDFLKAVASAGSNEGRFLPRDLSRVSGKRAGEEMAALGSGALQREADRGVEALGQPIPDPHFFQRLAVAGTMLGGLGYTAGLPAAGAGMLGAYGMASKGFQRALMGRTESQRVLAELLREYANELRLAGMVGRQAGAAGVEKR